MRGETETGITLMQMDDGMDTGPVYTQRIVPIGPDETAGELAARLAELAARVVREDVARVIGGELRGEPQAHDRATYAPPLTRDDARIDWTRPAAELHDQVRGLAPQPGAFTLVGGRVLRVLAARVVSDETLGTPGQVSITPRRQNLRPHVEPNARGSARPGRGTQGAGCGQSGQWSRLVERNDTR